MIGLLTLLGVLVGCGLALGIVEYARRPRRAGRRDKTTFRPCPWCDDPNECSGHYR